MNILLRIILLGAFGMTVPAQAVEFINTDDLSLQELLEIEVPAKASIGSRSGERSAFSAVVPVDVISAAQLRSVGQPDLSRALAALVPGFNYPRPSITDGTDHQPPFSLRTLNPDQVLVLVNGKRQHQSSLLNINGTMGRGTSSVDLNAIPIQAIDRVEILRDGAAAQYGSDAIAGIINIVLKGYGYQSQATLYAGQSHKGDGLTKQAELFYSHPLANDGFMNVTLELKDREGTNRARPDPKLDNQVGIHFGDVEARDYLLGLNSEMTFKDTRAYLHGTFNHRSSSAGALYRYADNERNVPEIYPHGFLPKIEPKIYNYSFTAGLKGVFSDGTQWDASYTRGANNFHFYVRNSLNQSLGANSPTSFESGTTHYEQQVINLELSKRFQQLSLSTGIEVREEMYQIKAGEEASYIGSAGDSIGYSFSGSQGFPGFSNLDAIKAKRYNQAAYVDASYALTPRLTLDSAMRGEHYNGFGSSLNGKLAARWRTTDSTLLRTSISNGFRAPSLSQANYNSTSTLHSEGELIEFGVYRINDPLVRSLGAESLKAEKSVHYTAGMVMQPLDALSLSVDYFITDIKDRILPTNELYLGRENLSDYAQQQLIDHHIDSVMYFTNAIETRTKGVDVRANLALDFENGQRYKAGAGYQYALTKVENINSAPSMLGLSSREWVMDEFSQALVEFGQPQSSFKLWSNYSVGPYSWTLNLNRYGSFVSTSDNRLVNFSARWVADTQFSYQMFTNVTVAAGVNNFFNTMPSKWGETNDNISGTGKIIEYSQLAPFGYNGAEYYLKLDMQF